MLKSKLFDLLGSLDRNEFKKFNEFLRSPYFNKSKVMVKLYSVYSKFYPDFNRKDFTPAAVFRLSFPGKNFNSAALRNYNSDLLKLAETYMAYHNIKRNRNNISRHLLNELNRRNIRPLFKSNFKSALRSLEASKNRDTTYYYDRYRIFREYNTHCSFANIFSAETKHESERCFLNFALSTLTEMYSYTVNQKSVLKAEYEFLLLDELKNIIDSKPGLLEPVVWMHYNRLMLHLTGEEKYYLILKDVSEKHGSLTDTVNHFDTYICLINYVRKHKDPSLIETTRELFELRKIIIEKNILEGKNYLSHNVFYNQVKSGLKLKEYKWVLNFIETFKNRLVDKVKENTYNFCLGFYYYETGDNINALKKLSLVTGKSDNTLEVKNIMTKIFWDEDDLDGLNQSIASYKQYLAKNRRLESKTIGQHASFIRILEKIFKHRYDGKKINKEELAGYIGENEICEKDWLLEKIKEIK